MKSNIVTEYYYDNGQIRVYYHINERGDRHGLYKRWYRNGQLGAQCEYVNGHKYGLYQTWTENGQLEFYTWYDSGKCVIEVFMLCSPIQIRIRQNRVNIESSAFLAHVISDLDSKGIEYFIKYF
jgi:hypothetical protein